jgi:hypothetical protein
MIDLLMRLSFPAGMSGKRFGVNQLHGGDVTTDALASRLH